ncbi:hypothetical protein ACKP2L_08640 [Oenococcus alcoholitolerans]|uniref:RamC N-terminal domain-containing protein n=1 Tax=Oenococcus alcoholitolerans TaxID=931074 RepID=A0ABR4XTK6_9LACO|nr:hypothetical protein Q757_00990 [Oenococcus alcoholitolerans]
MDTLFSFKYFTPGAVSTLPDQGWKIHISTFYDNYRKVLKRVARYCYNHQIPFKYTLSEQLPIMLGKQASRISSGKLITVYPWDDQQFSLITRDLYRLLQDEHGPYILTDRLYVDAALRPRFGAFNDGTPGILYFYLHLSTVLQSKAQLERKLSHGIHP